MVIKRCTPARGHIDGDCRENTYIEQSVIISPNHFCEVCSLKCIKVLGVAHIVSVEIETCGINNWRPKSQTDCRASRSRCARVMDRRIEYAAIGHDENDRDDLGCNRCTRVRCGERALANHLPGIRIAISGCRHIEGPHREHAAAAACD